MGNNLDGEIVWGGNTSLGKRLYRKMLEEKILVKEISLWIERYCVGEIFRMEICRENMHKEN